MSNNNEQYVYAIEAITETTRGLATAYIIDEWQTSQIAIRSEIIYCAAIDGFIVLDERRERVADRDKIKWE